MAGTNCSFGVKEDMNFGPRKENELMAKHFRIVLNVSYSEENLPKDMKDQLRKKINKLCDSGDLLSDNDDCIEVEDWSMYVDQL
jgi:hypothetical protein